MFATLEQITSEEVEKLRRLAIDSDSRGYVDMHGIPADSNDIAYAIAAPIPNSKRENGHRGQRKRDNLDPQTSLPTVEYESILKYPDHAISDESVIAGILGIKPVTAKSALYSRYPWVRISPGTTTLGKLELYAHYRAANIVNKPREEVQSQLEATLERLRDYESKLPATGEQYPASITWPYAAPEIIIKDYVLPEKYRNVNLSPGEAARIAGLEPGTTKGVQFVRKIKRIFSGKTTARITSFERFVKVLNKKGMLTDEVIRNLEEAAETALSRYVPPTHGKNGVYPAAPDIKYESVLKHPEAPLPDIETIAYILGRLSSGLRDNLFYRHPWIKNDGTLKALETYLYFRAYSRGRNPQKQQLQLRGGLEKIQAYERKLSGLDAIKSIYYYSSSSDSEFGAALLKGDIKEGTFIYHSLFDEVGTIKSLSYKDGMPDSISVVFTENDQKILAVNYNEPDRFNIAPIPRGILLPDGARYEGDGNDGLHPMDYILGRKYNPMQIRRWISLDGSKDYNRVLQGLAERDTLVPGSDGNYAGESLARFAIIKENDAFFRRFGYEGSKKEVLRNAGRDLEERIKGRTETSYALQMPAITNAT